MTSSRTNFTLLIVVLAVAAGLFAVAWQRIEIDTDIAASLPQDDPVIRDALYLFQNHPFQDQLTIDVGIENGDPDILVACGRAVETALRESGLFDSVGMEDLSVGLPQLMKRVVADLPVLFTAQELEDRVAPLLSSEAIAQRMQSLRKSLLQMDAIGQSAAISRDPLGLRDIILGKLIRLAPTQTAGIYKGRLISGDHRHLLVMATPAASGTDTAFAAQLAAEIERIRTRIEKRFAARGVDVTLTPVGAYRAALDNETIVRRDVQKAILFSSMGIAILLMLAFPRPLIGLLSLLPAVVGTLTAFFVFSLIRPSISIMVLGFGGAIISITVDHGIAYLLFLDRPKVSFGKRASREVWSVGLLAVLTTVGAFGALMIGDFLILQQLGLFTALGICFSFLFVHTIFPMIFPALKAAKERPLPLPKIADRLFSMGPGGAVAAAVVFLFMIFFAAPGFDMDLSAMNTVSSQTRAAERRLASVWGDIFSKVFLMTEADSMTALQDRNDRLLAAMEADPDQRLRDQVFMPSMIFPGPARREENLAAWRAFWHPGRIQALKEKLHTFGNQAGFTEKAFDPFAARLVRPSAGLSSGGIPESVRGLIGISGGEESGRWRQFAALNLPQGYTGERFFERFGPLANIFAPGLFSDRLGDLMVRTFVRLLWIVGLAVVVLLLIFFLDVKLTLTALAPVVFAMICTLGTLNLMGRSLDLPALILAVVILGMGIDYSLFMVRSYQRYGRADHPSFRLIRSAVFMTAASTLIGFGVLAGADHALLRSAGIASSLGIVYSVLGVFLILPPLLKRQFEQPLIEDRTSGDVRDRVIARYRRMEPQARLFARLKVRLDPLFDELSGHLAFERQPSTLLDIGTGYGVPACWLVERYPTVTLYGIEPDEDRVRVANRALGRRGQVVAGLAPELPPAPDSADGAVMLDMMHYLSDDQLMLTFRRLHRQMADRAPLVMRCVMPVDRHGPGYWWVDRIRNRLNDLDTFFRSHEEILTLLKQSGFEVEQTAFGGRNGDMLWVRAMKATPGKGA